MTLLQIKIEMETLFIGEYSLTPIHWAGVDFDTSANTEWVFFEYIGSSIVDCGLDKVESQHEGMVKIVAMSETAYRSTQIADAALAVFKGGKAAGLIARRIDIISQGYDKTLGRSYIEISIHVTSL